MSLVTAGGYFLGQGLGNLRRHPLHAFIGVLTLAVSLILVGFLGLFMWRAGALVERLSGGLQLTVYLESDITRGAADELVRVIGEQWREVEEVRYHTQAEDQARNRALLPRELLEELDPQIIPAQPYLEVRLDMQQLDESRAEQMAQWFRSLDQVQGVDEVLFGSQKISVAFSLLKAARNAGFFIALVIVLAALFFVTTTTRLILESRRKEIEILLLVGATPAFVRVPHFIEGAIQGLLAAVLAFGTVWMMQRQLLASFRGDSLLVPIDLLPLGMATWFLAGGLLLGLLGSALGLARHLRPEA